MLISCAVTAQLICAFVFAFAKIRGSIFFQCIFVFCWCNQGSICFHCSGDNVMTVSGLVGRSKITTPNFLIVYCVCYLSTLKNRFVVKNCKKHQEMQFTKTSVCAYSYCTNEVISVQLHSIVHVKKLTRDSFERKKEKKNTTMTPLWMQGVPC